MMKQIVKCTFLMAVLLLLSGCDSASAENKTEEDKPVSDLAPLTILGRPEETNPSIRPAHAYRMTGVHAVNGRQGVACDGTYYYISGSALLEKYDKDWNLISSNDDPFADFETPVNHLGDIDVYNGEIYAGAENFTDGEADSLQIAVYDAETLKLKRTFPFDPGIWKNSTCSVRRSGSRASRYMTGRSISQRMTELQTLESRIMFTAARIPPASRFLPLRWSVHWMMWH